MENVSNSKIEEFAVDAVKFYINHTDSLKAEIPVNDRAPIWDGQILIYTMPGDRNKDLMGAIRVQVKGTGVNKFKEIESYKVPRKDLDNYMRHGGVAFFRVELEKPEYKQSKIFYILLLPLDIRNLLKSNPEDEIKLDLTAVPERSIFFENDIKNFRINAVKQQSFIDNKTMHLSDIDFSKKVEIGTEFILPKTTEINNILRLTAIPHYLYLKDRFASIPIEGCAAYVKGTEYLTCPILIDGIKYYDGFTRISDYKNIEMHFGNGVSMKWPRERFSSVVEGGQLNISYKGKLSDVKNDLNFVIALISGKEITFGNESQDLKYSNKEDLERFQNESSNISILEKTMRRLNLPYELDMTNFSDKDFDIISVLANFIFYNRSYHPEKRQKFQKRFFDILSPGDMHFLLWFEQQEDGNIKAFDPFVPENKKYWVIDTETESPMPLLSYCLRMYPVIPDNVYYEFMSHLYELAIKEKKVLSFVLEDIKRLKKFCDAESHISKKEKIQALIDKLSSLIIE
ncbi:MAG: hypothetical protein HDR82_08310 [Bacteroides sp.]|nr:hypothetical protein [Bacteroides sp.]